MDIVQSAKRVVTGTAGATSAAAGAVGGAVVTGVIGGVEGTARGIRDGVSAGSQSTPLAALTLAAVGAAGLVEWPVVVMLGGGALLLRQLDQRNGATETAQSKPRPRKAQASRARTSRSARPGPKAARKRS
jgi:hypothetical protein